MEAYQQLEQDFARYLGTSDNKVVACSSGTAALHLACEATGIPIGTKILVPEFTMIACARAATMAGLVPEFVDCDDTLCMDVGQVKAMENNTDIHAIMPVHIYGRHCNMAAISTLAQAHKWTVIEDMAECQGSRPHSQTAAACWSFYKNKIISGEEGGIVWFRDEIHASLARKLRTLGSTSDFYVHVPRGNNYRMSNAHAELIMNSLKDRDVNVDFRMSLIKHLDARMLPTFRKFSDMVNWPWVYDIRIPGLQDMGRLVSYLHKWGYSNEVRPGFRCMSEQKEYARPYKHLNAYTASKEVLFWHLPNPAKAPELTNYQTKQTWADFVVSSFNAAYMKYLHTPSKQVLS